MKKLFSIMAILACAILLMVNPAFAKEKKVDFKHFEQLGFSEQEVKDFTPEEYSEYSKMNGKLVSKVEKYFRISKDAAVEISEQQALKEVAEFEKKKQQKNGEVGILGNGSDEETTASWIKLTTTASDQGNKRFFFKNSFTWLSTPVVVLTDVIGMTKSASISIDQNTEYFKYTYDRWSALGNYVDTKNVISYTATKKDIPGYAFTYDLLGTDGIYIVGGNRGYMSYWGTATPTNYVGPANVYGHYSHQQVTSTVSVGLSIGGMTVTPALCFDDAIDTDAQFSIQ